MSSERASYQVFALFASAAKRRVELALHRPCWHSDYTTCFHWQADGIRAPATLPGAARARLAERCAVMDAYLALALSSVQALFSSLEDLDLQMRGHCTFLELRYETDADKIAEREFAGAISIYGADARNAASPPRLSRWAMLRVGPGLPALDREDLSELAREIGEARDLYTPLTSLLADANGAGQIFLPLGTDL